MCVLLKKPGLALARCQDVKTLVLATDIKGGEEKEEEEGGRRWVGGGGSRDPHLSTSFFSFHFDFDTRLINLLVGNHYKL